MKLNKYILFAVLTICFTACRKLDLPPPNVVQDPDVFTTEPGIRAYMARVYSGLPIEDFRYSPRGMNDFWLVNPMPANTGEALSRDLNNATSENFEYYQMAYPQIRDINYFIETLPQYASNYTEAEVNNWLGEAHFLRAFTYYALVKRYGGVPLVDRVLNYPQESIEELQIPRSSEEAIWDFIAEDLDYAIENMGEKSMKGRANKWVAAAFKSRAMLHAGSIAKYNQVSLFDGQNRVCGVPAAKAAAYYKSAYDAAKMLDGKYSLYKNGWSATDKEAQYQNFVDLFFDDNSAENIFVRQYNFPESAHGYDAYNVPRQLMGGNGYSSEVNPTLNFVELFDGFPKNANGTIKTLDDNGDYVLYDNTMEIFANAEPRLRASVILPGDNMKEQSIEIRRGIYTGTVAGGLSKLVPESSTSPYPTTNILSSSNYAENIDQDNLFTRTDGTTMTRAGLSGYFTGDGTCAVSGFSVRKYIDPDRPTSDVLENRSDQTWIEIRYAEVLLNLAEAAYELNDLGETGSSYLQDAFTAINMIRERAGATLLATAGDLNNVTIVRNERRKELAFENKIWWDLKRWRILDKEQNGTVYRVLMPFYASQADKYFLDARLDQRNSRYTFDVRWYYQAIPGGVITRSPNIIQNPGY